MIVPNHDQVADPPVRPEEAVAAGPDFAAPPAATTPTRREPASVAPRPPARSSPLVVARTADLPAATFPTVGAPPAVPPDEAAPVVHQTAATEETTVGLTGDKPALTSPSAPEPPMHPRATSQPERGPGDGAALRSTARPARPVQRQPTTPGPAGAVRRPVAPIGPPLTGPSATPTPPAPATTAPAHERAHPSFGRAGSQDAGHDDGGRRHPVNRGPDGERRHAGE